MQAAHPPRRWNALWLVAGIVAGASAFALGFASGFSVADRAAPRASESTSTETVRIVERERDAELAPPCDELRRLREEVERLAAAAGTQRVPITGANDDLQAIRRAIEALSESSRTPRARSEALSSMKAPIPELVARLAREYATAPPRPDDESTEETWNKWQDWWNTWRESNSTRILAAHLLWTPEDVVAAYGRPDRIEPGGGGPELRYLIARTTTVDVELVFYFTDGYTVQIAIDEPVREK
jgi:hypothetical protein